MKKVMFVLAMLSLGTLCWAGSAREDATERLGNATTVLHEIMGMPDKGIPEEVLEHAKCVAVIPHMVKGGLQLCLRLQLGLGSDSQVPAPS
jgi:lipid-binding SYLF domain-containing protein